MTYCARHCAQQSASHHQQDVETAILESEFFQSTVAGRGNGLQLFAVSVRLPHMSDLSGGFEKAQQDVKTLTKRPGNDDLAFLYGHFKQATVGDVTGSKPGRFDLVGRAKYDSWTKLAGLTKEEAMRQYIDKVAALLSK